MWPFRRKNVSKPKKALDHLITGLIIGGAIGSIIGKKMVEEDKGDDDMDEIGEE